MHAPRFAALAVAVLFLVPLALADDDAATAEAVKPFQFGAVVTGIEGEGPDGAKVRLDDLKIDAKSVESAILELAKAVNEDKPAKLDTAFTALPGLVDDGEVDDVERDDLIAKVGKRFGLVASDKVREESKTLKDLATWVLKSEKSPIMVMIWSPKCPMCKRIYDERVVEIAADTGARLLVVASNYPDTAEHVTDYLEGNDFAWNVILDPEQKISDRLGGRKTPHVFLLGADFKLHYKGTIDNDPRGKLDELEKKEYLREAIDAVKKGNAIPENMNDTEPAG